MRTMRARGPLRRLDRQPRRRRSGAGEHWRAHNARRTRGRNQAPRPPPGASVRPRAVRGNHTPHRSHGNGQHRHPGHPAQSALAHILLLRLNESAVGVLVGRRITRSRLRRSTFHRPLARRLRLRRPIARRPRPGLHRHRPLVRRLRELQPGAVQILLLGVHPVDLARAPSQERHAITAAPLSTRATGSQGGEIPDFRPLARGWTSPSRRSRIDRRRPRERAYEWGEKYS
jgi:hypothetical protein